MKKIIPFILFAVLWVGCKKETQQHEEPADRGYIVELGDEAPDFTANLMNGSQFKLSDYRGKVVMLQFTASWCGVCRKEMPFIEKEIYQKHKEDDLVVVGIDLDEPIEKMEQFVKDTGISYPLAFDPDGDIFGLYANKEAGVTRNVIIDREGKIIYLTRLFNREEFDSMKEVIEKELAK